MKTLAWWLRSAQIAWAILIGGCWALGITVDGQWHYPIVSRGGTNR